jgi:crotonobetainyl-CoA:carnitine CoA-transferase CaiB-like acyl-CoA transferase
MGVLGALVSRARTGEGQRVELIMMMAALDLQNEPVMYHLNGRHLERPKTPIADTFHRVPYGFYATKDGHLAISMAPIKTISEALGSPPELEAFHDPELAFTRRDEIRAALDPFFRRRTTAEWVELLRAHDIWCAPVNDLAATFEDVAVRHIAPALEFDHPRAGRVRALKHPVRYSSGEAALRKPPPELGEHTDEILTELGYDTDRIRALRQSGDV